jgi:putative transposase
MRRAGVPILLFLNQWGCLVLNLPLPPPGFRGLDPGQPVRVYRRHLPHWRQNGATYFVTFRLNDALPGVKQDELRRLRENWERTHPEPRSEDEWEQHTRDIIRRTEAWSDEGHGACWFREPRWAQHLQDRLQHFNGQRYHLGCSVVMPNHCHLVIRPFEGQELEDIIGTVKGVSAKHINTATSNSGNLWQQECFDRIIRDGEHLWHVIQYIGKNTRLAGLPQEQWHLWIDPEWHASGWKFVS